MTCRHDEGAQTLRNGTLREQTHGQNDRMVTCKERGVDHSPELPECGLSCRAHPDNKVLVLVEHNIRSGPSSLCCKLLCVVVHRLHWPIQVIHVILPRHIALLHGALEQR